MFGRSFKPAKCKTALRLAISRMKLLKNKRDMQLKQTRRDLAHLLQSGQESTARIRVEHVIREQNIIAAYEFIELFCELIVARLPIIESQKNCPIDLQEAISSLIFAAPRCADVPELSEIQRHFGLKYGKEFVASAAELRPQCGVNRTVIEKLSARTPGGEEKLKIMKEIAKEHQIEWDPTAAEKDLSKPHEDLLDGPSKFVGATKIPIELAKESYQSVSGKKHELYSGVSTSKMPNSSGTLHTAEGHYTAPSMNNITKHSAASGMSSFKDSQNEERSNTDSSVSRTNVAQVQASTGEKRTNSAEMHKESLERTFHSLSSGKAAASSSISNEIGLSKSNEWNMKFKDVASAAQAAAYSAEKASEAAKAAAELSKVNKFQKQDLRKAGAASFSPSSSDDDTMGLNNSRMTRKPNDHVQLENQSFYGNNLPGRHDVVNHSENAVSHESERWKSSHQKGTGAIGNEYELPMKSTSQVDRYQWPSDKETDDNMSRTRKPVYDRREDRQYVDSREDKPYVKQDSNTFEYGIGSQLRRRETSTSHLNTQSSEDFYDSFNRKSESAEELEMKRPKDSRNIVSQLPLFDDSPSNIKLSPQMNEKTFVQTSSLSDEEPNEFYESNTSQPRMPPPRDLHEPSQLQSKYLLSNRNRYPSKVSAQTRNASYDSSSSEDDVSNSVLREKPSSNNFMQSGKWSFNDRDGSAWDSAEARAKNGKMNVFHQNEITDVSNEYDTSPRRNSRTDHNQHSNKVYWEGNRTLSEKSIPLKKEQDQVDNHEKATRQETNMHNSVAEVMYSHSKNQASNIFGDSDGMTSDSEEEIELERYNNNSGKVNRLSPFSNLSCTASSSSKPDNLKHTEDVSTATTTSVTETNPQYQPLKQSLSRLSDSSQTGSQFSSSAEGSKVAKEQASKRASHVHPKLPDYDDLAARFASMKRQ